MRDLSDAERRCLGRIARGQSRSGESGEAAAIEALIRLGLIERQVVQALPLENRRFTYILTQAGRRALAH